MLGCPSFAGARKDSRTDIKQYIYIEACVLVTWDERAPTFSRNSLASRAGLTEFAKLITTSSRCLRQEIQWCCRRGNPILHLIRQWDGSYMIFVRCMLRLCIQANVDQVSKDKTSAQSSQYQVMHIHTWICCSRYLKCAEINTWYHTSALYFNAQTAVEFKSTISSKRQRKRVQHGPWRIPRMPSSAHTWSTSSKITKTRIKSSENKENAWVVLVRRRLPLVVSTKDGSRRPI